MTLNEILSIWDRGESPVGLTIFRLFEDDPDDWRPVYTQNYLRDIRDIPNIYRDKQITRFEIWSDDLYVYMYL